MITESTLQHPKVIQDAQEALYFLTETFRKYPLPPRESPPQPEEWARFLLRYPEYVEKGDKPMYEGAAQAFAASRKSADELRPDMQRLAGTLIAMSFSQEELTNMAYNEQ
jgi:hypothetical protein